MRVFVQHDAATVARLAAARRAGAALPQLACESVILSYGSDGPTEVLASCLAGNPLAPDWLVDLGEELPGSRLVAWSGTMAATPFGDDPRTWMGAGRRALAELCDAAAPTLVARSRTLCFRPHARHVLSDPQSCVSFARERAGQPFELALAPADLLTTALLAAAEDHLARAFDAVAPHACMLLAHDLAVEGDSLVPVPLGRGSLPAAPYRRLLARWAERLPIVVLPSEIPEQLDWLLSE